MYRFRWEKTVPCAGSSTLREGRYLHILDAPSRRRQLSQQQELLARARFLALFLRFRFCFNTINRYLIRGGYYIVKRNINPLPVAHH